MNRRKVFGILVAMAVVLVLAGSAWGEAGELIWQKQLSFLPDYNTMGVNAMAVSETSFIIGGWARNLDPSKAMGFLKAFDVATGKPKWTKKLTVGATANTFTRIIVDGDLVLVRGISASNTLNPLNYSLYRVFYWAYNADTGKLLWQVVKNFETSYGSLPSSSDTIAANNRIFFYAFALDNAGVFDFSKCIIRAYQVRD